jgi:2-C-methyl-D-erythritol 4-phosphate cytidylyltransferase
VSTYGIVVAAGSGERFGRPKASIELAGVPLWKRAAAALRAGGCIDVVVVGDVPGGVPGGARRRDSVRAGLAALPDDADLVLVHDAARPLASARLVERVIAALADGHSAVVPGIPVRDTLKRVTDGRVAATLDRSDVVAVQTPQGFRVDVLRAAHAGDDDDATDDAALVERTGGTVAVVPGEEHNLKITYPGDLKIAAAVLS